MASMVKVEPVSSLSTLRAQPLTDILKELLKDVDESGESYEKLVAKTLMNIAAGKAGKARDHILAAQMVFDRIDGKAKQEAAEDFFASYPKKGRISAKYRITDAEYKDAEESDGRSESADSGPGGSGPRDLRGREDSGDVPAE